MDQQTNLALLILQITEGAHVWKYNKLFAGDCTGIFSYIWKCDSELCRIIFS